MSVDLKDLEAVPTLTLDPMGGMEEKEVPAPAPEKAAAKPVFDESIPNSAKISLNICNRSVILFGNWEIDFLSDALQAIRRFQSHKDGIQKIVVSVIMLINTCRMQYCLNLFSHINLLLCKNKQQRVGHRCLAPLFTVYKYIRSREGKSYGFKKNINLKKMD